MALAIYETVFIAEPEVAPDQIDQLVNKIKQIVGDHKGSVTAEDRWGRRRMAYAIQGHKEGFYDVLQFQAEPTVVSALEHLFNVTDFIIRHLTVRHEVKKVRPVKPRRERPAGSAEAPRPGTHRPGPAHRSRPAPSSPSAETTNPVESGGTPA